MQKENTIRDKFVIAMTESQGALYNYLFLRLGGDDAVREVLQETNLAIWKNMDHLNSAENFLPRQNAGNACLGGGLQA